MRKLLTFYIFLLVIPIKLIAQTYSISGTITDEEGKALEYANVKVMRVDSTFVAGSTSNKDGIFHLSNIPSDRYILSIHFLGYEPYNQEIDLSSNVNYDKISLKESSFELNGITITSKKPTIKRSIDRYTLSLSDAYIGGKSIIDILKFAPGVILDKNEELLINRKKTTVIVNNRQMRMSGEQLKNYLLSLNTEDVENIEVFTTPTSDMDAEGTGGIIKINLKKGSNRGTNLYANTGYNQGITPAYDIGSGFNLNINNFTYYASYMHNYREPYVKGNEINTSNQSITSLLNRTKKHDRSKSNSYRLGIEYALKNSHFFILETDIGRINTHDIANYGRTEINTNNVLDTIVKNKYSNKKNNNFYGLSFNYIWDINKTGSVIKFISDYFNSKTHSDEFYNNSYYSPKKNSLAFNKNRKAHNSNDISIFSIKSDFEKIINNKSKLNSGLKYSWVESSNDNAFYKTTDKTYWDIDTDKTNFFKYKESMFATYINYSNHIDKLEFSVGLRSEYTKYNTHSVVNKSYSNDGDYFKIFPTAFVMYPLNDQEQLTVNYSRRISRPEYRIMNPFEYFINEYNIKKGNESIKPSYSNNIELIYTLGNKYLTISYTNEKDMVGEYYIRKDDNITIHTYNNMANYNGLFLTAFIPKTIFRFWSIDNYINLGYHKYTDPNFKNNSFIFQYSASNYFSLPYNFKGEVEIGFSPKGSAYLYDKYETVVFVVNISAQKSFFKEKAHLSLFANDIINSQGNFETSYSYNGQYIYSKIGKDYRRFGLSFKYSLDFGKNKAKKGRERSNNEELQRK